MSQVSRSRLLLSSQTSECLISFINCTDLVLTTNNSNKDILELRLPCYQRTGASINFMSKYYVSQGVIDPPNKGHTVKPAGKSDSAKVHNEAEPPCGFHDIRLIVKW